MDDRAKEYPHAVTLRFRSRSERETFMGQLSDGWGENECSMEWPEGVDLDDAEEGYVIPNEEQVDHAVRFGMVKDDRPPRDDN